MDNFVSFFNASLCLYNNSDALFLDQAAGECRNFLLIRFRFSSPYLLKKITSLVDFNTRIIIMLARNKCSLEKSDEYTDSRDTTRV